MFMLGIIGAVIAAIAIGGLIICAIKMTFTWLKNKINKKFVNKNTKKIAAIDMQKMIDECTNNISLDQLNEVKSKGCTHVMASVDSDNKINDIEFLKDENNVLDEEVEQLLGREGMVVIER